MRNFIYRCIRTIAIVVVFCVNVSCPQEGGFNAFIAIGREVDQISPKISITSPKNGEYLQRGDLSLNGIASDNIAVTRIVVTMTIKIDGKDEVLTTETSQFDGDMWSVTFTEQQSEKLGVFNSNGAKVTFTASAYDAQQNSGPESTDSRFIYIDTTQPEIAWQKPTPVNRFYDTDYNLYKNDLAKFNKENSIDDPNKIMSFHNGKMTLSGFVKDNYSVASTYLKFIDASGDCVAVTPVIDQNSDKGIYPHAPEYESKSDENSYPIEIGTPTSDSVPMSWEYSVDTTKLTESSGWYEVEIVTADEAGNNKKQKIQPQWLYVRQDADIPRNNFNFDFGDTIAYGGTASGVVFDDDGIAKVRVAIIPEGDESILSENPLEWTDISDEDRVITTLPEGDVSADVSILNWSVKVPNKGITYSIFVVPIDINGTYQTEWRTKEDGGYRSVFSVPSYDEPFIGLNDRAKTIVGPDFANITGNFYDNEGVSKIEVTYQVTDPTGDNAVTKILYRNEPVTKTPYENETWGNLEGGGMFSSTGDTEMILSSGQKVPQKNFSWVFNPANFDRSADYKELKLTFKAYDAKNNVSQDTMIVYGDSIRPEFYDVTPDNNISITKSTEFAGIVEDNVDVTSLIMYCTGIDGFETRNVSLGEKYKVSNSNGEVRYRRRFSTALTPADIQYKTPTVWFKAMDLTGNWNTYSITIKADTTSPTVIFENVESGSYINDKGSFNIVITAPRVGEAYRPIKNINITANNIQLVQDMAEWTDTNGVYSKTFGIGSLGIGSGDVNIAVTATDNAGNIGESKLYVILDNEKPSGMEITSPTLLNKSTAENLTDVSKDISMEDIEYYLNKTVTFSGLASDNYKVAFSDIDIYKKNNDKYDKFYNVAIALKDNGDLSWDARVIADGSKWEGVKQVTGTPANYKIAIDTEVMPDSVYKVGLRAKDAADNTADASNDKMYFKVLQDADIPQVKFNVASGELVHNGFEITGTAFDDDGFKEGKLEYVLGFNNQSEQSSKESANTAWNNTGSRKIINGRESRQMTFAIPDKCSQGDGYYTLMLQPTDTTGVSGDVYTIVLHVASSSLPIVKSVTVAAADGGVIYGSNDNAICAGNVSVSVNADAQSGNTISQIWYRLISSAVQGNDETTDSSNLTQGSSHFGKWFVKNVSSPSQIVTEAITFNSSWFVSSNGLLTIEVRAVNNKGEKSEIDRRTRSIDNEKPTVEIKSPSAGSTVDATIDVTFTIKESGSSVKNVYLSYYDKVWDVDDLNNLTASSLESTAENNPAVGKWLRLGALAETSVTQQWLTKLLTDNKSCSIAVAVVDQLNNVGYHKIDVTINQDNNRPTVVLSNLTLGNDMSEGNRAWHTSTEIYGTVTDLDGTVKKIEYSLDNTAWTVLATDSSNFTISDLVDGNREIYFRITDAEDGVFVSQTSYSINAVKIKSGSNEYGTKDALSPLNNTVLYLIIDTGSPRVEDVKISTEQNGTYLPLASFDGAFGGVYNTVYIEFNANDTNGIADGDNVPYITFNGGTTKSTAKAVDAKKNGTYRASFSVAAARTGIQTFSINVKDKAAVKSGSSAVRNEYQIQIDNDKPEVTFLSPSDNTTWYGTSTNTARVMVTESSNMKKIEYQLKSDYVTADNWTEITTSIGVENKTFLLIFDTAKDVAISNTDNNAEHHLKKFNFIKINETSLIDTDIDTAQTVSLSFRITDALGNVSNVYTKTFKVLPNGDKPQLEVLYPTNGGTVGGTVRINGTITIEDGNVDSVWVQIDPTYETAFNESWQTELNELLNDKTLPYSVTTQSVSGTSITGIKTTNTARSWSLSINANSEYNMASARSMAIRVYAISDSGKLSDPKTVTFGLDSSVPKFGDSEPIYLTNGVISRNYSSGMWISGESGSYYIKGSIEDDNGIATLIYTRTVNGDADQSGVTLISEGENQVNDGRISVRDDDLKNDTFKNWDLNIPITFTGDYGTVSYHFEATEHKDDLAQTTPLDLTINYDKSKPVFHVSKGGGFVLSQSGNIIKNSSKGYTISGDLSESGNQSGLGFIVAWVTRTLNDDTYVIDPMLAKGNTNTENRYLTTVTGLTTIDGMYARKFDNATLSGSTITLPIGADIKGSHIRPGGVVKADGAYYVINGVNQLSRTVSIDGTLRNNTADVYFPMVQVIDNLLDETYKDNNLHEKFFYDGDNPSPSSASTGISNDDGDQMRETVIKTGGTYDWDFTLNTVNIYDGPVDMHFIAFDKADNSSDVINLSGVVQNNTPRIAGVIYGTDTDNSGTIVGDEIKREWENYYAKGNTLEGMEIETNGCDQHGNIIIELKVPKNLSSPAMSIKDKIEITPQIVGGNGGLDYKVFVGDEPLDSDSDKYVSGILSSTHSEDGSIRSTDAIAISLLDLYKLTSSDGIGNMTVKITDKTEGGSFENKIIIKVKTVLRDNSAPTVIVNPLYWKDSSDNSLYLNSKNNGHIELGSELPTAFDGSSAIMDRDDKVSGIIRFDGTVSDNVQVKTIYVLIPGFNGDLPITIANRVNGVMKSQGTAATLASSGWMCVIEDGGDVFADDGTNTVTWHFVWDTSKIANSAQTNVNIGFSAIDKGYSADGLNYVPNESSAATYKVDVVPYITGVSRNSRYNSNRARSGAVPLLRGEELNSLTGFNLKNGDVSISITENKDGGSSIDMIDVTVGADNADGTNKLTFTVPNDAVSGWLQLSVNGVSALNNINAYTQSNTETNVKAFDHNTLTDDRYVHIWRVSTNDTFAGSKNCVHPAMTKNAEGTLYASFSNYGEAKTYYTNRLIDAYVVDVSSYVGASMLGNTDDAIPNGSVQENGVATVFYGFDPPEETAITASPSGEINVLYAANFHGGAETSWNGTGSSTAGGLFIYDEHGTSTYAGKTRHNIYRSELYTYDNELNQFKNIRITRTDDYIYVVYYDRLTNGVKICIVNDAESGVCHRPSTKSYGLPWITLDGGYDGLDNATRYVVTSSKKYLLKAKNDDTSESFYMAPYSSGTSSQSAPGGSAWIPFLNTNFNDGLSRTNGTGESVAITTTSSGYPVVLYMDAGTGQLRQACANKVYPNTTADWNVYSVLSSTDPNYDTASDYISCVVDSSGYLHIAFQNTKGELVYAKSTNNPADGSKFTFGTSKSIDDSGTMIDLTLNGIIPYISYYSRLNSYDGMRLAFYNNDLDENNDGIPDGGWETMSAALNQKVTNVRSCIATQAKAADSNTYTAAIGFSPGADYRAAFYVGQ